MSNNYVGFALKKDTKKRLLAYKQGADTYDMVINRLLNYYEKNKIWFGDRL